MTSGPNSLAETIAHALVGVDRAKAIDPGGFLDAASRVAFRARAGLPLSAATSPAPEPGPDDELAPAPPHAVDVLARVLVAGLSDTILEWFRLAAARRLRPSYSAYPAILDWCVRPGTPREAASVIIGSLGPRATWLASLNPRWSRLAAPPVPLDVQSRWAHAESRDRASWVSALATTDRPLARTLVDSTWSEEDAETLAAFVRALARDAEPADFPLLERAAQDKRKTVRQPALAALRDTPTSALALRLRAAAESTLAFEPSERKLLSKSKPRLTITPPKAFEPSWAGDGLVEPAPRSMGQRAWWLRQLLASVPPSHWSARFAIEPWDLLASAAPDDHAADAIAGFAEATIRFRDGAWLPAILRFAATKPQQWLLEIRLLLADNPAAEPAVMLLDWSSTPGPWDSAWAILACCTHAWSYEFSSYAIRVLSAFAPPGRIDWHSIAPRAADIAQHIDPSHAAAYADLLRRYQETPYSHPLNHAVSLIDTRAELHASFS